MRKNSFIKIVLAALLLVTACKKTADKPVLTVDAVLIGGGIMSSMVGGLLHELDPEISIEVFEKLDDIALESSQAFNNAGTGHAAYSELNYTPITDDGKLDIKKAVEINEAFELSKQFWAYLVKKKKLVNPSSFINDVPHMSMVWGEADRAFLKKRYEVLKTHPLFKEIEYTENPEKIKEWAPLVMEGRNPDQIIAATKMEGGVDINFGELTKAMFKELAKAQNVHINLSHEVYDFKKSSDGSWAVFVKDLKDNEKKIYHARNVFIGAGGAALPLLQKTKIKEGKGFAGFPVGGQWLVTDNSELVTRHLAKVYGKASVGAPPMSVPHLDTRFIDGKRYILFGPFAIFSTKFLKSGSYLDILASFRLNNAIPMIQAGLDNIPLTRYLIEQVMLSHDEKMLALKQYFPLADAKDWKPMVAGQRVQIIKNDPEKGGILQFGTEVVSSDDGSMTALLGASPGASIAVKIALEVLEKSFKTQMASKKWQDKISEAIPSYKKSLTNDPQLLNQVIKRNRKYLGLKR